MKTLILTLILLFTLPALAQQQGILTEAYKSELQQNIDEIKALKDAGLATDRDNFMLKYYTEKLQGLREQSYGAPYRAVFTTAIQNKEPTDDLTEIAAAIQKVSFFTELRNMGGQVATHRWSVSGKIVYTKDFKVGADRWRVWSTKTITPYKGNVVVVQILVNGKIITQETLRVD